MFEVMSVIFALSPNAAEIQQEGLMSVNIKEQHVGLNRAVRQKQKSAKVHQ